MAITSNRWIRRMAETQCMTEPFEPNRIKRANGRRVASCATSSYGYAVRCSSGFRIFTNINSVIVDTRQFDGRSFVDFKGDVCETSHKGRGGKYQGQVA